eukprot:Gregarina_sp_Poly_1__2289@NODE_160_length_12280_cov_62_394416_g142_i0_p2_GENE_NODE_160_length_12280_cov_62_394416_g142_i0NODE_160_length_12280_cov_62_394416_g142_i0_p2_ORF_typecomplete_len853_score154_28Bromodomain/PF00439_25/1_1e18DUF4479/PF14794_6/0_41DUF4479/PF14794_6/2_4e03_NODE_160_length_12280_cov_62_394416_g142_i0692627
MDELILDRAVHGECCTLGELFLTEDEVRKINLLIAAAGFRFIPAAVISPPNVQLSKSANKPHKRVTRQSLPPNRETASPSPRQAIKVVSPATKRKASTRRVAAIPIEDSSSEIIPDTSHPKKRKKLSSQPSPSEAAEARSSAPPSVAPPQPELPVLNTASIIRETPKSPPVIEIKEEGREAWETACSQVSEIIEKNPLAKYFLHPVDPETEGLPEYFEKVQTPMDLHTVRQKLEGHLYTHPYRWQHDIRSIFFNAFVYFEEGSPIWRCAAELAVSFENMCKENLGVNPYAVYRREAPSPLTPLPTQTPIAVSAPVSKVTSTASVVECPPVAPAVSPPPPETPAPSKAENAGDVITLDSAQLKALLQQAAEKGITDLSPPASNAASPKPPSPPNPRVSGPSSRGRPQPPKGVRLREGMGVVYTLECTGTPFEKEMSRNPPVSALPPPCPVPAAQVSDTKSPLIPTVAQKKSTLGRFKELDVTYRKAVLDLVKNELGIHSLLCALDSRYTPEVDVLPILKQRQFFLYMKALVTQQKLAQDTHHLPATLPRILNWNTSQEPPETKAKKILVDRPASPVDVSPWVVSGRASARAGSSSEGESSSSAAASSDSGSDSEESSSASSVYRTAPPRPPAPASEKKPVVRASPVPQRLPQQMYPPSFMHVRPGSGKVLPGAPLGVYPGARGPPFHAPTHPVPLGYASPLAPGYAMPGMPRHQPSMPGMHHVPMHLASGGASLMPHLAPLPRMPAPNQSLNQNSLPPTSPSEMYRQQPMPRARYAGLGFWRPAQPSVSGPHGPPTWSMSSPTGVALNPQLNGGSCWGEWKTKVLQETFLSQTRNVGVASERESRAEKADAEI